MPLQNIIITASINSQATQSYNQKTYIASTDEQSFPIEMMTGSHAEVWPDFVENNNYTINQIVNVTQSWSGSNMTISGSVPYIQNTLVEFFNGEFSGSVYLISNGSLIDEDCEQFLTVNDTPTNYSIFPYATQNDNSGGGNDYYLLNTFLNSYTVPLPGQTLVHINYNYNPIAFPTSNRYIWYINYIKVAKIDQEGRDNTLSLRELTHFQWTDSARGKIILKITNNSEHSSYFLYSVIQTPSSYKKSTPWTSFIDEDNILDYSFSGSNSSIASVPVAPPNYPITYNSYTSGSGIKNFNVSYLETILTENIFSQYTASITTTNYGGTAATFSFSIFETDLNFQNYNPVATTSSVILGPSETKTFTLKGLYPFIGSPAVYYTEITNLNTPISLSNASWIITQSNIASYINQIPQSSTSSVILEPFLLSGFTNSECDVLMNNYSQNDISEYVRKVLYDNGSATPSNLTQIIDNTAELAEVNDYIYSVKASTIPRYLGTRTTSPNFNQPAFAGFTNVELSILDVDTLRLNNPTLPNVDIFTSYFAYFETITDNFPRNNYGSKVYITKLVGPGGELLPLSKENKYIIDVETIFKEGSTAQLYYTEFIQEASEADDASLVSPSNYFDAIIEDSAKFYDTIFYFRPNLQNNDPYDGSVNELSFVTQSGRFDLDLFDTRALSPITNTIAPYKQQGVLFNARYNLYSLVQGDYDNLYFKFNIVNTGSNGIASVNALDANSPYTGSGLFMAYALTLTNPFVTSSLPSSSISKYSDYWPIRFNTGSNYEVNTSLLPLQPGDYVRIFNSVLVNDENRYIHIDDRDVLFFRNVMDVTDNNIPFPVQRGLVSFDRKITDISITLPAVYIPVYNP